jgi:hypothetical protein
MPGKRVLFDDETFEALVVVARRSGRGFQKLADASRQMLLFPKLGRKDRDVIGCSAMGFPLSSLRFLNNRNLEAPARPPVLRGFFRCDTKRAPPKRAPVKVSG